MDVQKVSLFRCFAAVTLLLPLGTATAQPLVTGDLSVYYSFDSFQGNEIPDRSGNDLRLDGEIYGIVGRDDSEGVRGSSAFIFSEPDFLPEHFIAIGGCDGLENPEACEAIPPDRIPTEGYTVASWVKLQSTGGDQSIHQVRSGDGSFVVHAQAQGDGQLRLHLRGQQQSENITGIKIGAWQEEEWFHFAATYDQPDNEWALYINGTGIAGGSANLDAGNLPLGDWGQGSLIGVTPDRGRQAFGHFDEYYIFTRAITPEEVRTLYDLEEPVAEASCDFNLDGVCDITDIDNLGSEILSGANTAAFDLNGDGNVDLADQEMWRQTAGPENGLANGYLDGDSNLDGKVDANDLNSIGVNWLGTVTTSPWSSGDFNADGVVNATDLNRLALNWQQTAAAAPATAAVPEPNSMSLLLAMSIGLLAVRRKS